MHPGNIHQIYLCAPSYLKDLLAGHLNATVSRLRLLQRQLVAEQLQFMHQVSLVAHRYVSLSSAAAHPSAYPLVNPDIHRWGLGCFLHLGLVAGRWEEARAW